MPIVDNEMKNKIMTHFIGIKNTEQNKETIIKPRVENPEDISKKETTIAVQNTVQPLHLTDKEQLPPPDGQPMKNLEPPPSPNGEPEVKPDGEPELKPDGEPEVKPELKPDGESELKPESEPELKPELKSELKPDLKPEVKPEVKLDGEPEVKPELKPDGEPEVKPDDQSQEQPPQEEVQKKELTLEQHHQDLPIPLLASYDNHDNIEDSDMYHFNSKEYHYLTKDNMLHDFEDVIEKNLQNGIFNANIILFRINSECENPFVEFLLDIHDQVCTIRNFSISINDYNSKQLDANQYLQINYESALQEILNINKEDIQQYNVFKGFLENDGVPFLFFDTTQLDNIKYSETQIWAILDEIINEKRILDYPVDNAIINIINENNQLLHLIENENETQKQVPLPLCLYLCENNDSNEDEEKSLKFTENVYKNTIYADDETRNNKLLYNERKIEHDIFGFNYYFTSQQITLNKNVKRYAVFVYDTLYILNKKTPIRKIKSLREYALKQRGGDGDGDNMVEKNNENDNEIDDSTNIFDKYTSIFFIENNRNTWCIKTLDRFIEI